MSFYFIAISDPKNDAMQGAISEMMARIQKGIALKAVDMNERVNITGI